MYLVPIPGHTHWARAEAGLLDAPVQAAGASRARKRRAAVLEGEEQGGPDAEGDDAEAGDAQLEGGGGGGGGAEDAAKRAKVVAPAASASAAGEGGAGGLLATSGRAQALGATDAEANSTEPMHHAAEVARHNPLPDTPGMPALVRMASGNQPLLVGDMVEVYGILSSAPDASLVGAGVPQEGDTPEEAAMRAAWAMDRETAAKRPSASLVVRLTGLLYRKLNPSEPMLRVPLQRPGAFRLRGTTEHEVAAAVAAGGGGGGGDAAAATKAAEAALQREMGDTQEWQAAASTALTGWLPTLGVPLMQLRSKCVEYFAAVLGGDVLAGEWMLLHLLSGVTTRVGGNAVGTLHLNITGCPDASGSAPTTPAPGGGPPSAEPPTCAPMPPGTLVSHLSPTGRAVHERVAAVLPRAAALPLTIAHLNALLLFPRKDYVTNRLLAGALQAPPGTQYVLDETVMRGGTLLPRGIDNHRALSEMLASGTLAYDFGYFPQAFNVDLPTLILSHTRSLFTTDAELPLDPGAATRLAAAGGPTPSAPEPGLIQAARVYLACARALPYQLEGGMEARVGADWTTARGANPKLVAGDLHRWLTLARLVSVSCGEGTLTPTHWAAALALEDARLKRITAAGPVEDPRRPAEPASPSMPAASGGPTTGASTQGTAGSRRAGGGGGLPSV